MKDKIAGLAWFVGGDPEKIRRHIRHGFKSNITTVFPIVGTAIGGVVGGIAGGIGGGIVGDKLATYIVDITYLED